MTNRLESLARARNAQRRAAAQESATPIKASTEFACGRCSSAHVSEEEVDGSSMRWFVCERCGNRWSRARRR
jgi:DNA-directed RNA polymerase subunit M/transcription elongation factor TFIIS